MTVILSRHDFEDILIYAERFEILFVEKPSEIYPIIDKYMTELSLNAVDVIMRDITWRMQDCEEWNIDMNDCWKKLFTDLYYLDDPSELADKFVLSYDEFEAIIINAQKYAIGRMTFAPHTVCEIINHHLKVLSIGTINVLIEGIEWNKTNNCLGNLQIDAPVWMKTLEKLKQELAVRNE